MPKSSINSNSMVSTHSRPKAAGLSRKMPSQPARFQHTAARRRLVVRPDLVSDGNDVSTHSRPKAAGALLAYEAYEVVVSTHSRPKAAGASLLPPFVGFVVSTHSRPKAAGTTFLFFFFPKWFQHTAARRRLESTNTADLTTLRFQHTAARRRLGMQGLI